MLADLVAIIGTLDIVFGEVDRWTIIPRLYIKIFFFLVNDPSFRIYFSFINKKIHLDKCEFVLEYIKQEITHIKIKFTFKKEIQIYRLNNIAKEIINTERIKFIGFIELAIAIRHLSWSKRDIRELLLIKISHCISIASPVKKSFWSINGYS